MAVREGDYDLKIKGNKLKSQSERRRKLEYWDARHGNEKWFSTLKIEGTSFCKTWCVFATMHGATFRKNFALITNAIRVLSLNK